MSLVARTALAVGAVSTVILVGVGSGAYLVVRDRTIEAETVKLEVRSQAVVTGVESRLRQAAQSVEALARNVVIGNALLDSAGREIYVRPLLDGMAQIEGQPVGLALLDFRGRPLLNAGPRVDISPATRTWLRERIDTGTPGARMVRDPGAPAHEPGALVIAYPVLLPNTRTGEGALALRIPSSALLAGLGKPNEVYRLGAATLPAAAAASPGSARTGLALALGSLPPLDSVGLTLGAEFDRSAADDALSRLQWQFLVFGLGAVLAMVLLSVFAARRVTLPIRTLAAMAQRVSRPGQTDTALEVAPSTSVEVGMLAHSLQRMLIRLDEAAKAQRASLETQFRVIFDGMVDGAVIADEHGTIASVNPAVARLLGHERAALVGSNIGILLGPTDASPVVRTLAPYRPVASPVEVVARHQDGRTLPIEWASDEFHSDGRRMFIVMMRDISERKRADEQMRSALREKEVLLKEIYHRVKNNLQVVSSLLSLQGRRCSDDTARELLQDSANRIKSMALVHEQLYQARDLSLIDFSGYLEQLARHLHDAHGEVARRVQIRTEAPRIELGIETAIPLGLIVNELVSNAFKHAYPGERAGEVWLRLTALDGGRLRLSVSDSGVGLPSSFRPEACSSLGMQLVLALTAQLGGTLGHEAGDGASTCFMLDFPPSLPESRRLAA